MIILNVLYLIEFVVYNHALFITKATKLIQELCVPGPLLNIFKFKITIEKMLSYEHAYHNDTAIYTTSITLDL